MVSGQQTPTGAKPYRSMIEPHKCCPASSFCSYNARVSLHPPPTSQLNSQVKLHVRHTQPAYQPRTHSQEARLQLRHLRRTRQEQRNGSMEGTGRKPRVDVDV